MCLIKEDLELKHLRKQKTIKKIPSNIGTLLIFNTSLPHSLNCSKEVYRQSYYQKIDTINTVYEIMRIENETT